MAGKKEDALIEAHDKFIDIQLVLEGTDNMEWKPKTSCLKPPGEYNRETDAQFFADHPDTWIKTKSGSFVIFFPENAHMPLISLGQLHKVVVKVALNCD